MPGLTVQEECTFKELRYQGMMAKRYNAEKAAGLLREPSRWVLGPNRRPMLLPPRTKPVAIAVKALDPVLEVQVETPDFGDFTGAALPIAEQARTFNSVSSASGRVSQGAWEHVSQSCCSSKPSSAPARSTSDLQGLDIHRREPQITSANLILDRVLCDSFLVTGHSDL
eukprot:TRINITY_DN77277_c0_g1_i1.p1 TRINITY_DN77277_c0_g1~~TRINITY_DN77277_c0_g1_i1.p1  ORF type:complete len:169 (+),score=14.17 TRINITY_DN77277_c0_g1_i1:71-577(+)